MKLIFLPVLATVVMWRGKKSDQRGGAHSKGGTKFYEPGWGQLHTKPHVQEPEEELVSFSSDEGLW